MQRQLERRRERNKDGQIRKKEDRAGEKDGRRRGNSRRKENLKRKKP